jgi:hypothetical protein
MLSISAKSDAIALTVLALELALPIAVISPAEISFVLWIFIYLILAIAAIYCWRNEKSPKTPGGWLAYSIASVVFGIAFFACDIWIGGSGHPNLSLLDAAKEAVGPFGFGLTLIVCPGLTFISVAGIAGLLPEQEGR